MKFPSYPLISRFVAAFSVGSLLLASIAVQAAPIISVNVTFDTADQLAPTDSAGLVPAVNWNNASRGAGNFGSFSATNLVDDEGANTGASFAYSSVGNSAIQRFGDYTVGETPYDPNRAMLGSGFLAFSGSGTYSITISDLPESFTSAGYMVYLYWGGASATSGTIGDVMTGETTLGTETFFIQHERGQQQTIDSYTLVTATSQANAVTGLNTILFGGSSPLTSDQFTINMDRPTGSDLRLGLSGIQIVAIPEPSTYALFSALGALGLIIVRKRSGRRAL